MENKDVQLYDFIDQIVWEEWDPLGINNMPEARDEYNSYLPEIVELALEKVHPGIVAKHLFNIEVGYMGMPGNLDKCMQVAVKISSF